MKYSLHKTLFLLLLLAAPCAQAQRVSDVDYYQKGKQIIVTYTLDSQADITVSYSTNGGKSYSDNLQCVMGDVGLNVSRGEKKTIIWDVLAEVNEFSGDNIIFKVEAKPYKPPKIRLEKEEFDPYFFWLWGVDIPTRIKPLDIEPGATTSRFPIMSLNSTVGIAKKFGGYIHGSAALTNNSNKVHHASLILGGIASLSPNFRLYLGVGGASHRTRFVSNWGVATDVGFFFNWRALGFRTGTIILFKDGIWVIPSVGVGVYFGMSS